MARIFAVYVNKEAAQPLEDAVFVRQGFNIKAGLLTVLWTLYHRLWLISGLLFSINLFLTVLEKRGFITSDAMHIITVGFIVFVGFFAHDWYEKRLQRKGMELFDVVVASNEQQAQQRFLDHYADQQVA